MGRISIQVITSPSFTKQIPFLLLSIQSLGVEAGVDVSQPVEGSEADHEVTGPGETFLDSKCGNVRYLGTETELSKSHPGVVNVSVDVNLVFRVRPPGGTGVVVSPFNLENTEQT